MNNQTYFYQFLEPISKELAFFARELETSIFTGPRTMLTHARIFVENILQQVMQAEKLPDQQWTSLKERIDLLNQKGIITSEIRDALHHVRQIGNQASHDSRPFRYSEALLSWESVYKIVKWYVEVYGPVEVTVPAYQDPSPHTEQTYDITELEMRLKSLEELLLASLQPQGDAPAKEEAAPTSISTSEANRPTRFYNHSYTYSIRIDNLKFLISYGMHSYCHSVFLSPKPSLLDLEPNSKPVS